MVEDEKTVSCPEQRLVSHDVRNLVLLAIGFGCMIAFSRMLALGFVGYLSQGVVESVDVWYGLRSAVTLATFVLLAVAGWRRWVVMGLKALVAATLACVAAAIVFAVDTQGSFGWIVALTGGIGSAIFMYVWMMLLSCFGAREIIGITIGGSILSGIVVMGVPGIDQALALVVAVACAFGEGAVVMAYDADLEFCTPDGSLSSSQAASVPWLSLVMVVACGFLVTVLYGIAQHLTWLYDWSLNYALFGAAAAVTVAATLVPMVSSRSWTRFVWLPQFVLLLIALALSCFSMRESIQLAVSLMLACVFCAHFLHWVIFPALFYELRIPRTFLAAVLLFCVNGSLLTVLGDVLGAHLPHSMQNLGGVAGLMVIALAIVFAATLVVCRRAFGSENLFDPLPAEAVVQNAGDEAMGETGAAVIASKADSSVNPLARLQGRVDVLGEEYGLTPREREIAFHTAQGFSCSYIAGKLVVSESTVRFHQKNLYRKLDVHSRNELIEFVGGLESSD